MSTTVRRPYTRKAQTGPGPIGSPVETPDHALCPGCGTWILRNAKNGDPTFHSPGGFRVRNGNNRPPCAAAILGEVVRDIDPKSPDAVFINDLVEIRKRRLVTALGIQKMFGVSRDQIRYWRTIYAFPAPVAFYGVGGMPQRLFPVDDIKIFIQMYG